MDAQHYYDYQDIQNSQSANPYLNAAPRSLAAEHLAPAGLPTEAELYCSFAQCIFGLTRGVVVGGDAVGMLYAPLRQYMDPNWVGGSIYVVDVFGGFQVLRDVNGKSNMNVKIGFRRFSFDDGNNHLTSQGITTQINYAQSVTPVYTQGLSFAAYINGNTTSDSQVMAQYAPGHAQFVHSARYFYRISQKYPTYQLSLPGDLEVANWTSSQTGLRAPLRLYGHIEPFYIQNNLDLNYTNIAFNAQEQNFGVTVAGTVAYESTQANKAGRFSLLGTAGITLQTSNVYVSQVGNAQLNLPGRDNVVPKVEIAGSWQF